MEAMLPSEEMMRAAVITGAGRMEVRQVPLPEPKAGEVRIRLEGCGVCASNLGPWSGPEWMTFPTENGGLGHEGWGWIDAVGPGVDDLQPGDRVAALSYHAYAEYDVATADAVVKLPDSLAGQPFPGEPLGCAVNIFERSGVEEGQTVAIVGIGFLGALLTQLCVDARATVIGISRRPFALEVGRRAGAQVTLAWNDSHAIVEEVRNLTGGALCDVVIEAVGKQHSLDLASELTGERGRLVIAGYHQDGPRQINMQMWNWHGLDVINAHERDPAVYVSGIRKAVYAVASGRLDPGRLLTHRFGLPELGKALNATRDRPDGFLKAVVVL